MENASLLCQKIFLSDFGISRENAKRNGQRISGFRFVDRHPRCVFDHLRLFVG